MRKPRLLRCIQLIIMAAFAIIVLAGCENQFLVLEPRGPVAETQYQLIVVSAILCAIVVIPVIILTVFVVYRYRDRPGNKAPYKPEWAHNTLLEVVWWGIPVVIIALLGFYTVKATFALPKPPAPTAIKVQVTSLDWKWLFIYPEQKIATVNYAPIPAGVPVQFEVTSDAPMNSFWVPQLGGQVYTMPGMAMRLWLQADQPGEYFGQGANFTGKGFAHMQFKVVAKSQAEFDKWANQIKKTAPELTMDGYRNLAKPGLADVMSFSSYPEGLFEYIVNKNGGPNHKHHSNNHGTGHETEKHDMSGMHKHH
ncbi:ubiquinol oxidase subunit II [Lihuaxuella thermophila]|uniref:Quinol oxidase subunit 2 n=1 Tax=Lihuaxuella thermophila TaxID=1173111 RepID=A0A1H8HW04_9BACL|nr:COX aromatic rich motif-containing protein [Lihuaxuella thermophila]SEN60580.1 cytochrome aa3-600 menaquinol oxidase subunit 2 [Lihuaxuella thermophila]